MNNLPYDCPVCPQPSGFCFNAGQMGGLPVFGGGEISPDSYTVDVCYRSGIDV